MEATMDSLSSPPELTPLEQEVLEEYERLSENMNKLALLLDNLAANPSTEILDGLRDLERKTSLVFTLLKASVYSIVLQQEIAWDGNGEGGRVRLGVFVPLLAKRLVASTGPEVAGRGPLTGQGWRRTLDIPQ